MRFQGMSGAPLFAHITKPARNPFLILVWFICIFLVYYFSFVLFSWCVLSDGQSPDTQEIAQGKNRRLHTTSLLIQLIIYWLQEKAGSNCNLMVQDLGYCYFWVIFSCLFSGQPGPRGPSDRAEAKENTGKNTQH